MSRLRVAFTPQLRRFLDAPPAEVEAEHARQALDRVLAAQPRLRGYLLDERGRLRRHVAVFLGGELARAEADFLRPLPDGTEVLVMQALSGG